MPKTDLLPYIPPRERRRNPGRRQVTLPQDDWLRLNKLANEINVSVPVAVVTLLNYYLDQD
jgi:hypothetical protein